MKNFITAKEFLKLPEDAQIQHLIRFLETTTGCNVDIQFNGKYDIRFYNNSELLIFCPYDRGLSLIEVLWLTLLEVIFNVSVDKYE